MSVEYEIPFENQSGEEIPAFGVTEIKGPDGIIDDEGEKVVAVERPQDASSGVYVVAGPVDVDDTEKSHGSRSWGVRVLYDVAETPVAGEVWGPVSGQWGIGKDGEGFTILGDIDPDKKTVRVGLESGGPVESSTYQVGLISQAIPGASSGPLGLLPGTFEARLSDGPYDGTVLAFPDATTTVYNAYVKTIPVTSGSAVVGHFLNGFLINIDCAEITTPP